MTDYELFAALNMSLTLLWVIFTTFVSVIFAFLVASYLVAGKLSPKIVSVVITLFTLVSMWAILGLGRTANTVRAVIVEIRGAILSSDSSLSWAVANMPDTALAMIPIFPTGIGALAYIGSLIFFFSLRKDGLAGNK